MTFSAHSVCGFCLTFGVSTVAVRRCYPMIPQIRLYQYRFSYPIPYTVLIEFEIVDASLLLPYVHYLPVLPVDYYLGLYGMTLLFP
jgi:hypothetical protein